MHIFSAGPMCSLRRTLLLWLLPLFLLVGGVSAAFSYWSYGRMAGSFLDGQMQHLADSVAAQEDYVFPPVLSHDAVHKGGIYVTQVYDAQGRLQASAMPLAGLGLVDTPGFHDLRVGDALWRVYATPATKPSGHRVQVLQSGQFRRHIAAERAGSAVAPVMIMLPLAILVLWGFAGAVSREIQDIARRTALQEANSITELPLTRVPKEIAPLVVSFNSLLARLRDAFATQKRFVQDAAHELRTPITAVALQLENVRGDLPAGICTQSFAQLEAGVGRAQRLVDQLLKLSRHEAVVQEPHVAVDLQSLLRESINGLIALADQRNIDLGMAAGQAPPGSLAVRCSPGDLRSVLDNLLENALRYTPEGGVVDVQVSAEGGHAVVEIADTGPGIPADQLDRVFDRFYRVPGNGTRGSGLGLAIAQGAAQRCGLRVRLRNRSDRSGLVARIEAASLPA